MRLWAAIPPHKPERFGSMKITSDIRRLCTDDETRRLITAIVRAEDDLRMAKAALREYYNAMRRPPAPKLVKARFTEDGKWNG